VTDDEKDRLWLALRVMAKVEKIDGMSEGQFRMLGFDKDYEDDCGRPKYVPPTHYLNNREIREHCVGIVFDYITRRETENA